MALYVDGIEAIEGGYFLTSLIPLTDNALYVGDATHGIKGIHFANTLIDEPDANGIVVRNSADNANRNITAAAVKVSSYLEFEATGLYVRGTAAEDAYYDLVTYGSSAFLSAIRLQNDSAGNKSEIGFFATAPVPQQNVPTTTPSVQNIIDALVALGLVEQSD